LQRLFDIVVDFPDLQFRSGEVIRAQHPVIFEDLPISSGSSEGSDGAPSPSYDSRYKSPCWVTKRAPKGAGAMVGSELSAGQLVCLPYVYVLGQPKCGTSDLFERLRAHDMIRCCGRKETILAFFRAFFDCNPLPLLPLSHSLPGRRGRRRCGGSREVGTTCIIAWTDLKSLFTSTSTSMWLCRGVQHHRADPRGSRSGGGHPQRALAGIALVGVLLHSLLFRGGQRSGCGDRQLQPRRGGQ
jgi:hypothetical protein